MFLDFSHPLSQQGRRSNHKRCFSSVLRSGPSVNNVADSHDCLTKAHIITHEPTKRLRSPLVFVSHRYRKIHVVSNVILTCSKSLMNAAPRS